MTRPPLSTSPRGSSTWASGSARPARPPGECGEEELRGDPLNPLGGLDSIARDVWGLIAGVSWVIDVAWAQHQSDAEDLREVYEGLIDSFHMIGRVVSSN